MADYLIRLSERNPHGGGHLYFLPHPEQNCRFLVTWGEEVGVALRPEYAPAVQERFRTELDKSFRLPLIAYFLRRVGDRNEAEDLTQEVLLRVLRNVDVVDVPRAKAYIFTAAANLLRDRARQAAVRQTESRASLDDPSAFAARDLVEEISPERVLLGKETLQDVLAALGELSERTRDIFVLYRIEKMKQHEIASLFGLSLSAVEKHVVKAIAHLSKRFGRP